MFKFKTGQWVMIVQWDNENNIIYKKIGIFLEADGAGDAWVVIKDREKSTFPTGQYCMRDLIPLHNCTGFDYTP